MKGKMRNLPRSERLNFGSDSFDFCLPGGFKNSTATIFLRSGGSALPVCTPSPRLTCRGVVAGNLGADAVPCCNERGYPGWPYHRICVQRGP